jgi:tRNA 2-selenouridine synthase
MRETGRCWRVQMDDDARLQLLLQDYAYFSDDVAGFCRKLESLVEMRGRDTVSAWQALARAGRWREVFAALMEHHYDPLYERSLRRSFAQLDAAPLLPLHRGDDAELAAAARQLMA